jgi:transposase
MEGDFSMARGQSELTEKQWAKIAAFLPEPNPSPNGGPRPIPNRRAFEGILWVLRSGARWKDLPKRYPSPSTCWRRLRDWEERGLWLKVWRAFLAELDVRHRLKWVETFADGTFSPEKKGAPASARPNAERVRSLWWWQTARVFLWECTLPRPHQMK